MRRPKTARSRNGAARVVLFCVCLIAPIAPAAEVPLKPILRRGPYPQLAISHSIVIVWRTVGKTLVIHNLRAAVQKAD